MATHVQAIKRHRQSLKRRDRNRDARSEMKTSIKNLRTAIEEGTPKEKLEELFRTTESIIARTGRKGVIKKQTVARRVSRLATAVANAPETAPKKEKKSVVKKKKPVARAKKKK